MVGPGAHVERIPLDNQRSSDEVVLRRERSPVPSGGVRPAGAWRAVGWFGLLLTLVALTDMLLVMFPVRQGDPTWEFGVVDALFSGLPLLTVSLGALVASGLALRRRWLIRLMGTVAIVLGVVWLGAYVLFLTDVPIALANAPEAVLPGVKKAIVRNTVFGVLFAAGYLAAGVAALRELKTS
jgi:hypothetical protein